MAAQTQGDGHDPATFPLVRSKRERERANYKSKNSTQRTQKCSKREGEKRRRSSPAARSRARQHITIIAEAEAQCLLFLHVAKRPHHTTSSLFVVWAQHAWMNEPRGQCPPWRLVSWHLCAAAAPFKAPPMGAPHKMEGQKRGGRKQETNCKKQ